MNPSAEGESFAMQASQVSNELQNGSHPEDFDEGCRPLNSLAIADVTPSLTDVLNLSLDRGVVISRRV
jgi:hypothetical protein